MSKRLVALIVSTAATSLLATGCGDDDSGGEEVGVTEITKTELIQRGDTICARAEKEVAEQADAYGEENEVDPEEPAPEQIEEVATEFFVPSLRSQAEEIRELGAPEGDEGEIEAMLTALEAGADEIEEEPGLLLEEEENPLAKASELATEYGFTECGG
jgi:hypothetical protein